MGFKMKQGPISMKGSPMHLPGGIGNALKAGYNAIFGSSVPKGAVSTGNPRNMTRAQRNTMQREAIRSLYDKGRQMTHETSSKGNYEVPALGSSGYGIKDSGYKDEATGGVSTQLKKPTQTKNNSKGKGKTTTSTKRSYKEAYAKRDMNTYGNLTQAEYTAEAKRQKAGGKAPKSKMKGSLNLTTQKKTTTSNNSGDSNNYTKNINNKTQKRKEAEAKYLKSTDGKAPKVDKVLSKRELRLANVKRKAANEKTRTNKTAQSIDANKAKSADTGAKQTSARRSRAKAKRLENRATRIQGRIDRKGKSSAEKRASRKATRQKVRENR